MNNVNKFVKIVLLIIAGLFITILFCKFVPYNMDEFSSYQVIICAHYKNAHLNTFRESCGRSDLNVLNTGLFLPLREYEYIGSITSLYYYPVFLMWKSPVSARFMGIIFLLIQAIILSKIFKIKIEYIFLGLVAFFPYFFQHIVDTGVVGFQITLTYAAYYFLTRWFEKINLKYILIVSLLLFLGIWAKLTFVFFLPGLSLIFLQLLIKNRKSIFYRPHFRKLVIQSIISVVLLTGLSCLLFLSTDRSGTMYLDELLHSKYSETYSFKEVISPNVIKESRVFKALINPFEATHRVYDAYSLGSHKLAFFVYFYDFFIYLSAPLLAIFLFTKKNKQVRLQSLESLLMFFIFIITALFILRNKYALSMHHTILSFPFLVLSVLMIIDCLKRYEVSPIKFLNPKKTVLFWFLLFLLLNSCFFILFHGQKISDFSSDPKIHELLQNDYLSQNYFYVFLGWGYFDQALYGNENQSVLFIYPLEDANEIKKLINLSKEYDRRIMFIFGSYYGYNNYFYNSDFSKMFSLENCSSIAENSSWNVVLEKDTDPRNVCLK